MKEIKKKDLQEQTDYLVYVGTDWSPTGYDLAEFRFKKLESQSNGIDLLPMAKHIYELPIN